MKRRDKTANMPGIAALCAALALCAANAFAFEAWPEDALVKVLHDFTKPAKPADKVYVAMARAETEAGQVAFRGTAETEVSASVTPLRSDSGATINNVKAQFLNYHSIPRAQWPAGAVTEFIKHPDEFPIMAPDAFSATPAVMMAADQTRSLWVIVETKSDTPAGVYTGSVALEAGSDKIEIPVEVKVYEAVVPAKRSLKIYQWLFWNGPGTWGELPINLGNPEWGEKEWALVEKIADNMAANRQNMFMVPVIHNVLCGPDVHSVKTIRKGLKHNFWAVAATLDTVIKKGGENLMSGADALKPEQAARCAEILTGISRDKKFSEDEDLVEMMRACAAELEQVKSGGTQKVKLTPASEVRRFVGTLIEQDQKAVDAHEYEFDFSIFDRASDIFLERDPDGIIVGGWLGLFATHGREIAPGSGEFYLRSPSVPIFNAEGEQIDLIPSMDSNDPRYIAFLKILLPALVTHLKEKGRLDNFIMSLCDETFPNLGKARVLLADEIRKFAPEIKYNDANRDTERNVGSVDLWFPLPSHLECNIEFYRARQKAGEEVGYYTCVTPGGYNMNRFIDFPLVKTRLLHWHNYRFGTTAFLHWGYNPVLPLVDIEEQKGNGDGNIIYRDENWNIYSSIRQASQRDGMEDYELLKVVEAKDPEAAEKICAAIVTDCREYTRDVPRFRDVREMLLAAACPGDIDAGLKKKIMDLKPDHFTLLKDMPKDAKIDDKGWKPIYECDNFKPEALGTDWIVTSGKWEVENGVIRKQDYSEGHLFFAKGAGHDQKMEYTTWSDLPYPNDLTGLLCAELKKEIKKVKGEDTEVWTGNYHTAYLFQFGGEGNAFSKFMVRGVEMRVMPKTVTPGKKYNVVCRREGKRVTYIIDGEVILDAESMDTLDGEGNVHPGFYFVGQGNISSVKIYTKK